jgi:pimeloyl-ACP methyl ester carboxylesterase
MWHPPTAPTIAVTVSGQGRPLVLAHGSLESAQFWQVLAGVLAPHLTVYAVDRRGHGASGDNPEYSIEREQQDIAAVLDLAGPDAILLGHSYGAVVTLGLALARPLAGLVLYEPPLALNGPVGGASIAPYEEAIREGDLDRALTLGMVNFVKMPQPAIDGMRQEPVWPALASMAPSWPREIQAIDDFGDDLARFAAIDIPVLLIVGELSPAWLIENSHRLQQTMPNATIVEISGHAHVAHNTDPEAMADAILAFALEPNH